MTRTFATSVAGFVLASAFVAAQAPTPGAQSEPRQNPPSQATPATPATPSASSSQSSSSGSDVTMSGCLIAGSSSGVFVLDQARATGAGSTGAAQRYVVVATGESVDLAKNVNKRVTISGMPDAASARAPMASSGSGASASPATPATPSSSASGAASSTPSRSSSDANLPKFSAKTIVAAGDCSPASSN